MAERHGDAPEGSQTLRLVLMGTGPFAVPTFSAILQKGHEIALVVTRPPRVNKSRKGPPPAPVRQWAAECSLPLYCPDSINAPDACDRLHKARPDLLFVCDYGQILSTNALRTARLGGLNLHGSLLPAYRGAAPVQWSVLNGDESTGVSIIHMTPKLDGGPVILQKSLAIQPDETAEGLEQRLATLGVEPSLEAIQILSRWDGSEILGQAQDPKLASKAPRLSKADGDINWQQTAVAVHCRVRAMQPWPTAFTRFVLGDQQLRVTIKRTMLQEQPQTDIPAAGTLVRDDHRLLIACRDRFLTIDRLQPAGKREMSAAEFLRGHPIPPGSYAASVNN